MQVLLVVAAATSPDAAVLDALSGLADVRQEQLEPPTGAAPSGLRWTGRSRRWATPGSRSPQTWPC